MPLLRDQLQATLGTGFTLERELGGGGMSRVFVAEEHALGRKVVVKVLPPDMLEGVSVERFRREIQLAASLQHPHIVPVHSAGETNGLPFYTMPYVDGESLRERLNETGKLDISEATSVLREVAKALAYAHERGVVHRDIKPENVLLTGGTAVVTDFGIAKALSASRGAARTHTLTTAGVSIGTPAYMAPEQAAADPNIDHRADIYAFGCVAYELFTGQPPFSAALTHRVLAAHMRDLPQPIRERRPDMPSALADLVMRCLEKDPADRPQNAAEIVRALGTGNSTVAEMPAMGASAHHAAPKRVSVIRAFTIYLASAVATVVLAKAAVVGIGLPTWVVPGAIAALGVALVAMLVTMFVHHRTDIAHTAEMAAPGRRVEHPTLTRVAVQASPWITWRRTTTLGAVAVGVIALLAAGYAVTRAMGIGPAASLIGTGALKENERILVADFASPSDSTLGPAVTEAFRSDLSQVAAITVVQPTQTRAILESMKLPASTPVTFARAREIAVREGIKGVVDGAITRVGTSYVLTAALYSVSNASDEPLATFRSTARTQDDIIAAIGKLSREVRAKIGESLRSVNAAAPLEQVTTPSIEAMRKYAAALRIFNDRGNSDQGIQLLEEAVALDTGFAMAYRKLSIELSNRGVSTTRAVDAIEKAYAHRDRLSERERYLTIAAYYTNGRAPDLQKSFQAYEALLAIDPRSTVAYNNLANGLRSRREYARAESITIRGLALDSLNRTLHQNLFYAHLGMNDYPKARQTLALIRRRFPNASSTLFDAAYLAWTEFQLDSAAYYLDQIQRKHETDNFAQSDAAQSLASLDYARGRVKSAEARMARVVTIGKQLGNVAAPLLDATYQSLNASLTHGDKQRAKELVDAALARLPLESVPVVERPYYMLVASYTNAGALGQAKALYADYEASRRSMQLITDRVDRPFMQGEIALAEARYDDAVRFFRESDVDFCPTCSLPSLARAYDLGGNADSAIAVFTRYLTMPDGDRYFADPFYLAGARKRLGELLEAKGDKAGAASQYAAFLELWKNADPALQPRVAEVRANLTRLQASERR